MQIPIEPNLDIPMPSAAYPERGATFEERAKIAGNTALLLSELGMEEEITPEEAAKAKEMFAKIKPGEEKNSLPAKEEIELYQPAIALKLGYYINEYEKQVIEDKIQVRTVVMNRLMEISQDEDNKTALKALELLGKASDLFTDRSEITITHKTSDELKQVLKERIKLLMQTPGKTQETTVEKRLKLIDSEGNVVEEVDE
jgi:hypothetical protein